jgi:hypothetical protein
MTDVQRDKFLMYSVVKEVVNTEEHRAIWSGDAFFAELMDELTGLMDEIQAAGTVQETDNTGTAKEKQAIRAELIGASMKVAYGGAAHAVITNNVELLNAIDSRKRDLVRARDIELADMAGVIYGIAFPLRNELTARYVTAEDIERVRVLKERFEDNMAAPRVTIVEKKGATDTLKQKFRAVDVLLREKIDLVVQIYGDEYEGFVIQYFGARKMVRTGLRHTGAWVKGRVVVAGTDTGVAGARVTMPEKKRERVTDEGGYFKFLLKKRCKVSLVVEAEGFKRAVKDKIGIVPGKGVEVRIECENVKM